MSQQLQAFLDPLGHDCPLECLLLVCYHPGSANNSGLLSSSIVPLQVSLPLKCDHPRCRSSTWSTPGFFLWVVQQGGQIRANAICLRFAPANRRAQRDALAFQAAKLPKGKFFTTRIRIIIHLLAQKRTVPGDTFGKQQVKPNYPTFP